MDHRLTTAGTAEEFQTAAAGELAATMRRAIAERGRCTLALSGGTTPGPVYTLLAGLPTIDWSKVEILLVDERCVPLTAGENAQGLIVDTLLKHLPARPARFVAPDTNLPPDTAASAYGSAVDNLLQGEPLDVCVLGMGEDGHIASLYPPLPAKAHGPATAVHTIQDRYPVPDRISLTLPLLASARTAVLLLIGEKKRRTWEELLASAEGIDRWPIKALMVGGGLRVIAQW